MWVWQGTGVQASSKSVGVYHTFLSQSISALEPRILPSLFQPLVAGVRVSLHSHVHLEREQYDADSHYFSARRWLATYCASASLSN